MKKIIVLAICSLLFVFSGLSYSGENDSNNQSSFLTSSKHTEMAMQYFSMLPQDDSQDVLPDTSTLTKEEQLAQLPGYKLPKKALFLSALVPGAGEFWAKSYIKAAAFFMIEVGAWSYYASYNKKGKDKEEEYEEFADDNWNSENWKDWYDTIPEDDKLRFTHTTHMLELLDEGRKTQQYYEMIGKYAEFVAGWESDNVDITNLNYDDLMTTRNDCQIATDYMDMRYDSNKLFDKAKNGITIAMLNHLFSAIDAAWTAKKYNNRLVQTAVRIDRIQYANQIQPVLSLKISW